MATWLAGWFGDLGVERLKEGKLIGLFWGEVNDDARSLLLSSSSIPLLMEDVIRAKYKCTNTRIADQIQCFSRTRRDMTAKTSRAKIPLLYVLAAHASKGQEKRQEPMQCYPPPAAKGGREKGGAGQQRLRKRGASSVARTQVIGQSLGVWGLLALFSLILARPALFVLFF